MFNRRTFFAALALAASVSFAAPSSADTLSDISARGSIRVAVPQDFPPFGSVGIDMAPRGYDIDVANLIAEKLGVKTELVPVTSANRVPYLQTNKVDLVISSLGKNADREKVIDFSVAYAPFFNGVFAPDAVKIEKAQDLSGKTIGVTRGAVEDLELTKIAPADATIKRYEDNNGTISAFLSGQVETVATGNVVAAAILEKNPPKRPELKFLIKNSPCYIGLNKDQPALREKVDAILAAAKADGSLNAIAQKWLKTDLPKDL
ncbi:transporter substrate-binding domain-containing protein [Agrobacterium rosae]|uniref:Amino acid ABC transporter substrate-binding protein n=1 Tax=Agrobacterium rosae TaxID=1972867 RepID=A0AAE5RZ83_9HYPH|nr:transporter substrate-binding domain-containing protein [Agrobacterium rosae]KAA3512038.1 amino acid ABC transporter substrate-binding protein [Agrobacterium rosae]KAA3520511.1 amino acid ABC transporter substrate-binding protein [Agrobacterium rosae]MDX8331209.1 transporter substrate-binding domain-containing protein [Agrobacterium rosae]MQB48622.1 amino acid ABC transporter substrate-binding protein [Agrobacterium rosae]POO52537.1 amino acid ABC transporter substrate-binding protein [Agro